MNTERKLLHTEFLQRENELHHKLYGTEITFFEAVKAGNIKQVRECMSPLDDRELGALSANPLRNIRYHLIITIAFITRFCIEGDMPTETAYNLSDLYIQKADLCASKAELSALHKKMIFDFTKRMSLLKKKNVHSRPISMCLDQIHASLHNPISIESLAARVNLNPTYLSTLFKKEMGVTINAYIRSKRIEVAKNMLRFSEYSSVDIGNYLAFNSHSYFIHVFKRETGLTPKEFREKSFRSSWND
jgi:AraC family transcriptional regulator